MIRLVLTVYIMGLRLSMEEGLGALVDENRLARFGLAGMMDA